MKTEYITKIISNLDDFQFGYWDTEKDEFVPINEDNQAEIANRLEITEETLNMIREMFLDIKYLVNEDLADIWSEINLMEKKLYG